MPLTPLDVHNYKFSRAALGGYKADEVDDFCEQVGRDYEAIYRENRELQEQLEEIKNRLTTYEEMENLLKKTLLVAEATAEEVKTNAHKEKDLIIQQAHQDSKSILDAAKSEGKKIEKEYEQLRQQAEFFHIRFRTLLESHLKMLEGEKQDSSIENAS